MNLTLRCISTMMLLVLGLWLPACQDKDQEPAEKGSKSGASAESPKSDEPPSNEEKVAVEDVVIDETYPDLVATYDGNPVNIRAAIAFEYIGTNETPESSREVYLFTEPTNCASGKKSFIASDEDIAYVLYKLSYLAGNIRRWGGGEEAGGMGSGGENGIDWSKVDTTMGAKSTISIDGGDAPMGSMGGNPWTVKGTVTVHGCGSRK